MIRRLLVMSAVFLVSAVSSSPGQDRSLSRNPEPSIVAIPEDWDTFSADITLRHGRVLADGSAAGISAPESTFRFERSRSADGWKTVIVVLSGGPIAGPAGGVNAGMPRAQIGMRIEDAGDGSPIRMFDGFGKELRLPQSKELGSLLGTSALMPVAWPPAVEDVASGAPRARSGGGPNWIDGFVLPAGQRDARVRALELSHGQRRDRARGLDRYVAVRAGGESEILVDPLSALPVETNVVEQGQLVAHATYEYSAYGSDSLVRNRVRLEHAMPDGTGERTFTVMELTNVRIERRGGEK